MFTRAVAVLAFPLIASCDFDASMPAESSANVANVADDGNIAFDLPFVEGDIQLPKALARHGKVDIEGVGLPDGATIRGVSVIAEGEGAKVNIGFKSPDTPKKVTAYFLTAFQSKGKAAEIKDGAVVTTTSDGKPLTITAEAAPGGGSTAMISIQD